MAKVDIVKASFIGGEIGASLRGRVDVDQYATACQVLENFIVKPYGPIISTPGTEFIRETKVSAAGSDSTVRLIPFVFSRSDAYILEFGDKYFRFYTAGGIVITTGTTPYELAHVYTAAEVMDVQLAQINDVIYLTHPDHVPQKLTRLSAASWTIADFAFKNGPFMDDNETAITLSVSDSNGTINITVSPTNSNIFTVSGSTLGHHNTYWKIGGTRTNATTGLSEQGLVQITYVTNSYTATASVIKTLTVTGATTAWAEGAWSSVRGYPACVTFHEGRLWMARTDTQPQNIWASKTFLYDDFIPGTNDDDGLSFELSSLESNDIKWLCSQDISLLVGTFGGEFAISAANNEPLTPSNASARNNASWGSEGVQPKKIGNHLYYIQRFSKKIRELSYDWESNSYPSKDMMVLNPDIAGDELVDIAFQQSPDNVLWCVRTDGTIATLSREKDLGVTGWSKQITTGTFCSVAIIPSSSEPYDEVWVVVKRNINGVSYKRYVEKFKNITVPNRQDKCFYVHSGLSYDAFTDTAGKTISLSATSGTITVTSSGAHFLAADVGARLRAIDADGNMLGELTITSFTSTTIINGSHTLTFSTTSYAAQRWGVSASSFSGLTHLEGQTIKALADGGTTTSPTVASGAIALDYDYFVVHAGLGYNQNIFTLPMEAGSQRGTSQGKVQKINEIALKLNRSHKGFYIGGTVDLLDRVQFRDPTTLMGMPESLFTGFIANLTLRSDYVYGAQVYIRNSDPLPMEILQLITTVDTNDK